MTCWGGSMVNFGHEKISLPQVRCQAQLVRAGWRRSDSTLSMRTDELSVQRARGRCYRDALRSAGTRCHLASGRDQDTQVSSRSTKRVPTKYTYWGHRESNWIAGQGNGIASRNFDGQRTARKGRGETRVTRGQCLEADAGSSTTFESRQ